MGYTNVICFRQSPRILFNCNEGNDLPMKYRLYNSKKNIQVLVTDDASAESIAYMQPITICTTLVTKIYHKTSTLTSTRWTHDVDVIINAIITSNDGTTSCPLGNITDHQRREISHLLTHWPLDRMAGMRHFQYVFAWMKIIVGFHLNLFFSSVQ